MIKQVKALLLSGFLCLTTLSIHAQEQEIQLVFDTTGYKETSTGGIVAPPNIANDTLPSIKGEANVSALGGLNYTIPIDVVPGVNGFHPNLSLSYSSQGDNGIAGYGWNISGLSSIVIGGKSKEIDGITIGSQHDGTDPYYLDGGRLLSTDGINFTTLLFSKIKIEKQTAGEYSFIIQYPNGKIAKYKEVQKDIHLISVMIDSFDNQVHYTYDLIDEVTYLKSIGYGGTLQSGPKYFVNFTYKNRKVNQVQYFNGKMKNHKKVLSQIVVTAPDNATKAYRTYVLGYDYIQENTLERLIRVDVLNELQQKLPSLEFSYTDKDTSAIIVKAEENIQVHSDSKEFGAVVVGDFKGTGKPYPVYEVILPDDKNDTYVKFSLYPEKNFKLWSSDLLDFASYKRSRDLFAAKILMKKNTGQAGEILSPNDILITIDTDYKTSDTKNYITLDLFDLSKPQGDIFIKSIKFDLPVVKRPHHVPGLGTSYYKDEKDRYIFVGDVNNDGLSDLLILIPAGPGTVAEYFFYELGKNITSLTNGENITLKKVKGNFYWNLLHQDEKVYPVEFDGDGIPEFLVVSESGSMRMLKFDSQKLAIEEVRINTSRLSDFKEKTPLIFGDFNGDGLTDFITPVNLYSLEDSNIERLVQEMETEQQLWWVYTATGKDFKKEQKDFTAEKLAYITPSQHNVIRRYNTWDKVWSGKRDSYSHTEYGSSNIMAMDINGDGKTDLISFSKYGRIKYEEKLVDSRLECLKIDRSKNPFKPTVSLVTCEEDNGELKFFLSKSNTQGGFNFKELATKVDLKHHKISPLSFLYNKTDYNAFNVYKSSLVVYDPLTKKEISYTIERDDFVEGQLKSIDNGSGVVQEIEYSPMSEDYTTRSFYDRGDSFTSENRNSYYCDGLKLAYPYYVHKTNGTHYLVRKMHTIFEDKVLSKEYRYHNAVQHLEGKGLLGFQKTKISEVYESALNTSKRGDYSRDQTNGSTRKGYVNKYVPKDENKEILWKTYTYQIEMDNALESERLADVNETKDIHFTEHRYEKRVKPDKSYTILETWENIVDVLNGFNTYKNYEYTDDWLLERISYVYEGNSNMKEEKFTYLPAFTHNGHYFYGQIGKSQVISKREGHTFSTREEYTYNKNGAVETKKKYGNSTKPITTSYTYFPFGGIKEEKLTYHTGSSPDYNEIIVKDPSNSIGGDKPTLPYNPEKVKPVGPFNPGGVVTDEQTEELVTTYAYDASNRFIVKTTAPDGLISTVTVDGYGKVLSQTNAFGQTTTFKYDSWGNAHTIKNHLGKSVKTKKVKSKVEGARYDVIVTGDDGSQTITSYDLLDRAIQTKTKAIDKLKGKFDPVGPVGPVVKNSSKEIGTIPDKELILGSMSYWVVTRQVYDVFGNIIQQSQPFLEGGTPKWNYTTYDLLRRPVEFLDFNGKVTRTCYEKNKVTVEDGHKKTAKWIDEQGLVVKSQDQGGTILYKYFANGSLKEADYDGIKTTISIDGWGNKTKLVDPSAGTYLYKYDNIGKLIQTTNPKGGTTTYTYNKFGQLLTEKTNSTAENTRIDIAYTYDERSKLPLAIKGNYNGQNFTYSTVYDAQYRIKERIEETPAFTYGTTFVYDAFDRVESTTSKTTVKSSGIRSETTVKNAYQNGILHKQLDENNKLIWQINSLTNFGGTKQINYGNGYQSIHSFNEHSHYLENIKHSKNNVAIVDIDYTYDILRGTLLQRNNKSFAKSEHFSYDNLDRLLTEKLNNVIVNEYTYDKRGRTTSNSQVGKYNYNDTDYRLQNIDMNASGAQKVTTRGFATVNYNAFKSPNEIFLEGKGRVSYDFSILKNRYVAYFGSTETKERQPIKKYYSSDKTMEIVVEDNKTKIITYVTGDPYSANYMKIEDYKGNVRQSSKNYYLHRDNQQSIVAITDSDGNVIEQRYFDAWGNLGAAKIKGVNQTINAMGWTPGLLIDRGYTGHEHLYTVGLIHMNGRIYDPLLRRFMSPDNYVQDNYNTQNYNRYGYVLNNPLLYTDPSGEIIVSLVSAVVVSVVLNGIANSSKNIPFFYGAGKAGVMGGISAAISFGIGEAAKAVSSILKGATFIAQAGAHGIAGGALSEIEGGKFISGFSTGVVASLVGSGVEKLGPGENAWKFLNASQTKAAMIAGGGLSGGISSTIAGGDFWQGMRQGLIVSGLNHTLHSFLYSFTGERSLLEYKERIEERLNERSTRVEADLHDVENRLLNSGNSTRRVERLNSRKEDLTAQLNTLFEAKINIKNVMENLTNGTYSVGVRSGVQSNRTNIETQGNLFWGTNKFSFVINYNGRLNALIHEVFHVGQAMLRPSLFYDFVSNGRVLSRSYSSEIGAFKVSYSLGDNIGVSSIKNINESFIIKNGY